MGPAVYLTLTGRAREAVRDLKPADIGKETGLDEIIVKLDAVYLKDENTCAYVAFKEFELLVAKSLVNLSSNMNIYITN